jgi:hypothetical protein
LTGSTAGITPVVEARVEWRKKWSENDFGKEHRMGRVDHGNRFENPRDAVGAAYVSVGELLRP